jgi:hypothetical protein
VKSTRRVDFTFVLFAVSLYPLQAGYTGNEKIIDDMQTGGDD